MDADVVSSALSSLAGSRRSHSTRCYPEKRRSQAVHEWAAAHGWSYAKSDDSILRQWTPLPIRQGIARDVLRRTTDQGEVISLEQYYGSQTGSGTTWSWPCTGYSKLNASRKFCHSYVIWPEKSKPVTGVASHELAHEAKARRARRPKTLPASSAPADLVPRCGLQAQLIPRPPVIHDVRARPLVFQCSQLSRHRRKPR